MQIRLGQDVHLSDPGFLCGASDRWGTTVSQSQKQLATDLYTWMNTIATHPFEFSSSRGLHGATRYSVIRAMFINRRRRCRWNATGIFKIPTRMSIFRWSPSHDPLLHPPARILLMDWFVFCVSTWHTHVIFGLLFGSKPSERRDSNILSWVK